MAKFILLIAIMMAAAARAYPGMTRSQTQDSADSAAMDAEMAQAGFVDYASNINTRVIETLPVLNNGRIKPLFSLAKETMLFISGRDGKWGLGSLQMYLALSTSKTSVDLELINVRNPDLRVELGFDKTKRFFSLRQLELSKLSELARPLEQKEQDNAKSLSQDEKDILEAFNQAWLTHEIITGEHLIRAVDIAGQAKLANAPSSQLAQLAGQFFSTLAQNPSSGGDPAATELVQSAMAQPVPELFQRQLGNLELEVRYLKVRPFLLAAIAFLLMGSLLLIPNARRFLTVPKVIAAYAIPALLQIGGFAVRVYITGFAPVTSMYGTMLWVSFGVGFFSMVLFVLYRPFTPVGLLWIGSALILLLAESIPLVLSPDMDPIVAVLRSNYWLTIHVLTITISYAAFTTAMLIGNAALVRSLLRIDNRAFFQEYAKYAYRMIQLGVFLLTVGIILGGIWADYSWGRFWGWDPKETWALIADIGYLVILHARYAGWLDAFGILAASPVAYLLVVMAWYGVNFILAAGLHSYGFSSGGALAVSVFVVLQALLLAASAAVNHSRRQAKQS